MVLWHFIARARSTFGADTIARRAVLCASQASATRWPHIGIAVGSVFGAAASQISSSPLNCETASDGSSANADRVASWRAKWEKGQTKFHLDEPHPVLRRHLDELLPSRPVSSSENWGLGPRVVLPLCGKSVDMAYLAREGCNVLGIEGVAQAVQEFAKENSPTGMAIPIAMPPELAPEHFMGYVVPIQSAGKADIELPPSPVILVQGDFFRLGQAQAQALVPFAAGFDRGGLVAVKPSERVDYARVLSELIAPDGRLLLVTVEHDPFSNGQLGPPFEVTEADVASLFSKHFEVRFMHREDMFVKEPAWKERGCSRFTEATYLLKRRPDVRRPGP